MLVKDSLHWEKPVTKDPQPRLPSPVGIEDEDEDD
jgi:hypothetical protein